MQFSVDLTDGVVGDEDTAPACPAAASLPTLLAAALPSIKGDCFSGPSPTSKSLCWCRTAAWVHCVSQLWWYSRRCP